MAIMRGFQAPGCIDYFTLLGMYLEKLNTQSVQKQSFKLWQGALIVEIKKKKKKNITILFKKQIMILIFF